MSSNVTKRALSAGLGVGALALLAPRASADTPFSSFAFPATGAPTARTLPDRLGELKNVKDFGARGDGSTNDTAAIQAAINRGGTVYFPPGLYIVSRPITFLGSASLDFVGAKNSWVQGAFDGYVFDCPVWDGDGAFHARFTNLTVNNEAFGAGGCIRVHGGIMVGVEKCQLLGNRPISLIGVFGGFVRDCFLRNSGPGGDGRGLSGGTNASVGFLKGTSMGIYCDVNQCTIDNVDMHGFADGVRLATGAVIRNSRFEQCIRGISVGVSESGDDMLGGVIAENLEMEANNIHIFLNDCRGGSLRSVSMLGDPFNADSQTPSEIGLYLRRAKNMVIETLVSEGQFKDAAIKFDNGLPGSPSPYPENYNLIFNCVSGTLQEGYPGYPENYPDARPWKGLETLQPGAVQFTFCNQPK
jgi:Pectate lyase superfamily protein